MSNLIIAKTLADTATVAAGSAAADLPVTNLQTAQPSEKWRATALASAWVTIDLGAATQVGLVALLYNNLTAAATWRTRAAATAAAVTAAPVYDSTAIGAWPHSGLDDWDFTHALLWLGASPQTLRYWRIDLTDAANPAGYIQAGRLYMAAPWQLVTNVQFGWGQRFGDPSRHAKTEGGQSYPVERARARLVSLPFVFRTEAEMETMLDVQRLAGTTGDRLVIFDPSAPRMHRSWYGRFRDLAEVSQRGLNLFAVRARLEEMI